MRLATVVASVVALGVWAPPALAQGFATTRFDDPPPDGCRPSDCSLREAVLAASASGFNFIELGSGRYTLQRPSAGVDTPQDGDLDVVEVGHDLLVLGRGSSETIIDGGGHDRVFDVGTGARLSVFSVTIKNGVAKFDGRTFHWHGGGIHNHGRLGLFSSTLTANHVRGAPTPQTWGGGGLTNAGSGTAVLSDVTVTGNDATSCGGGIENGGALTLFNLSIAANTAPAGTGGGLMNGTGSSGCFFEGGTARVNNTILADNATVNCYGTMSSLGHNLATDSSCGFGATGDLLTAAPGLEPVFDADGHIRLYRLLPGSPAIDAGSGPYDASADVGCSPVDQEGSARPVDGNGDGLAVCDMGAVESPAPQGPSCDGGTATLLGTPGDDELEGTAATDVIVGLGGDDEIEGNGGDDRICGGEGDDDLEGGGGNDRLFGEAGEDQLDGGSGIDHADGGLDDDECDRAESEVAC